MAANIITEILKKIQEDLTDQKEYMKNLHIVHKNINEKFNHIEGKISHLDKKLDQQQVAIGVIKQQVNKNNVLLFGDDDKGDDTCVSRELGFYDDVGKCHLVEQSDNSIKNTEANELSTLKLASMHGPESNCENDNTMNGVFTKTDDKNEGEFISKELREMKELITSFRDYTAERNPSNEEAANPILEQMTELKELIGNQLREMKQSITLIRDFVTESNTTVEKASNLNHKQTTEIGELITNELREIKESISSINDSVAERYTTIEEVSNLNHKQCTEHGKFVNNELREIKDLISSIRDFVAERNTTIEETANLNNTQTAELRKLITSGLRDMKELMTSFRNNVGDGKTSIGHAANTACKQKTVQISPAYFSADQISKLNDELKRVSERHRSSEVFPIIEVIPGPGDEHPVMQRLREGVMYESFCDGYLNYSIKLGCDGWKTSDIRDLLTDNPDLSLMEVVKEVLISKREWKTFQETFYNLQWPLPYIFSPFSTNIKA